MRSWGRVAACLVWGACVAVRVPARAQAPGAETHGLLTLRPEPQLRAFAGRVAAVLELRTGQRVTVGEPPPPALPEAVPAGHLAMIREGAGVRLVLGARGGTSPDAYVVFKDRPRETEVRAVALAAESLRDAADETRHVRLEPPPPEATTRAVSRSTATSGVDGEGEGDVRDTMRLVWPEVQTLAYARLYGGASTSSGAPMAGVGTGVGLCVLRQCLFVAGELPATTGSLTALDVRYRYLTFLSGFYSRPISFGALTPGASLGFLTRLGHFRADMGYRDTGLDTDLGARGSLELAWEVVPRLDLMSEVGVDLTLDRHHIRTAEGSVSRGDRWSPWAQGALRFRP